MNEDEAPMLKLIMQKGPLSGRVMDCKPGSRIQIGRVIRGNTLAIKDAGISSKHLTIEFESRSGQWTVTDLSSSNGTVLNTKSLKPSAPYSISDGDVIKIGELTAIEVKIEVQVKVSEKVKEEEKREEESRPRRNPRRQAVAEAGKLGVIDENKELGLGLGSEYGEELVEKNDWKGRGRRGRVSKDEVKDKESGAGGERSENLGGRVTRSRSLKRGEDSEHGEGMGNVVSGKVNVRSTRSSQKEEDSENGEGTGNVISGRVSIRRTRSSKKEEGLENGEGTGNVVVRKVSLRRTRRGKKEEEVENGVEAGEGIGNVGVVEEEKGQTMNLRKTRSSTKEENLGENRSKGGEVGNLDVVEGRRTRKGTRGRDLPIEVSESVEKREMGEEEMVEKSNVENGEMREEEMVEKSNMVEGCEGEERNLEGDGADGMENKEDMNLGSEGADGLASTSGVKKSGVQVDLEKMTLGEWFDYLEEYLPKQIIHQTEDMILGMRQRAEKFHEFMLQQKAVRKKDEVSIG